MTEKRTFARNCVFVHLVSGFVMIALLVFHELFTISFVVLLWYLLSIMLVAGMMRAQEWCRPLLALMFLLIAVASALFITHYLPALKLDHAPMLRRDILPLWGVLASICYLVGAVMTMVSDNLKRATTLGFQLW